MGSLWDGKLVDGMYATLSKDYNEKINTIDKSNKNNNIIIKKFNNKPINKIIMNDNQNELLKFLKTIKDESKINSIGFYDLHYIAEKKKLRTMGTKTNIIKKIRNNDFKAAQTHFSGTGVRSNIPYRKLLPLLKE